MNIQRLVGVIGILRILTFILGILVAILTWIYHYPDLKEQFFLSIVIVILTMSVVLLIVLLLDFLSLSVANSVDMSCHFIGGTTLLLATGLMLYSVIIIGDQCTYHEKVGDECPRIFQPFIPRVVLAALGITNGFVYFLTGLLIRSTEYI